MLSHLLTRSSHSTNMTPILHTIVIEQLNRWHHAVSVILPHWLANSMKINPRKCFTPFFSGLSQRNFALCSFLATIFLGMQGAVLLSAR